MAVSLRLDWCSHEAAKYAVEHWHYSKSLPAGKLVKIGVWENEKFIGAVIFGYGANPHLYKPYGLKQTEVCELCRVALTSHESQVTKIIKIALKMLKESNPGIRLVISFADSNQGHIGSIYQAGNWIYTGISKSTPQYFVNGRWIHQRQLGSLGYSAKNSKFPKRKIQDKYRYIMPLDDEMRKQIEPLRQPYPKRGRGEIDSALQPNEETGGASPTRPLESL